MSNGDAQRNFIYWLILFWKCTCLTSPQISHKWNHTAGSPLCLSLSLRKIHLRLICDVQINRSFLLGAETCPLNGWTTVYLYFHWLKGILILSISFSLRIQFLKIFMHNMLYEHKFSFLLGKYLVVKLLSDIGSIFWTLWETDKLFQSDFAFWPAIYDSASRSTFSSAFITVFFFFFLNIIIDV